ncbi:MAG: hypothetical protein JWR59_2084 [Brevundimonas sp.]|nr:hypothetical protein [Brevundimonas sp.]
MIVDLNDIESDELQADLCIVGGGAAGLTLAAALAKSGRQILVLEAGGLKTTGAAEDLYKGEVLGPGVHPQPHEYRVRALGGSSRAWGGGCVPLDPIDFAQRNWTAGPGWPFGWETMQPFYRQAQEAAEAGDFDYAPPSPMIPAIEGGQFSTTLERFSRPTDFGKRWREDLDRAANVRVALNANATDIRLTPDGQRVDHIEAAAPDGRRIKVRATDFVLAMGGLEIPRLLLASTKDRPAGVGNDSGWVGRGYMCHMAAIFGEITFNGPVAPHQEKDGDGVYYRRRLLVSEKTQREQQILNLAFRLRRQDLSDPSHGDAVLSAMHFGKTLRDGEYARRYRQADGWAGTARHAANILLHPLYLARFGKQVVTERYFGDRRPPTVICPSPDNRFSVEFHGEQAPNPDSRLSLGSERDRLGMPRLKIDWRFSPIDMETVVKSYQMLGAELESTGAGRLDYRAENLEEEVAASGAYGGHHIGAARMSSSPSEGVVDADCAVHGLDNLFIASAAVMPTSGQANPTLTILALTYRLADHLAKRV